MSTGLAIDDVAVVVVCIVGTGRLAKRDGGSRPTVSSRLPIVTSIPPWSSTADRENTVLPLSTVVDNECSPELFWAIFWSGLCLALDASKSYFALASEPRLLVASGTSSCNVETVAFAGVEKFSENLD